jgi:hypothetical protein
MAWFRLDDQWMMHPKVRAAGKDGRALWIAGGLHCAAQLTDGKIDKITAELLAKVAEVPAKKSAKNLVDAGLWIDHGTHYEMHDYLEYQPARETVEKERAATKERVRAFRDRKSGRFGDTGNAVTPPVTPEPGNGVGNAVTSGDVTPLVTARVTPFVTPAPSHPIHNSKSLDDRHHLTPAAASSSNPDAGDQVAKVIELAVAGIAVRDGHDAKSLIPWKRGVVRNIREEKSGWIAAQLVEGRTALSIAGEICGGETWVRKATQSPNPEGYA